MESNGQAAECKKHQSQKEVSDTDNSSNGNALEDSKCYAPKSDVHISYIAFLHIHCSYLVRNEN